MMLDEVGAYLEAQGVGTVKTTGNDPAWPIYKGGVFPGTRDDAIVLAEGGGERPIDEMGSAVGAVAAEMPALVAQVRSASYSTARTKAEAIWTKLHKYSGTMGTTRYLLIEAWQSPYPVSRDDDGRWIVGCNYRVTKERSS